MRDRVRAASGGTFLVIYNPKAGGGRAGKLRSALDVLEAGQARVEVHAAASARDAEDRARSAASDPSCSVIVAAGGDGTIRDVVRGVASVQATEKHPRIGILPLGTTNVLARELCLPRRAPEAAKFLLTGVPRDVRFGIVNDRLFLTMTGVGFDAGVVQNVNLGLKAIFGRGAYVLEAVRSLSCLTAETYHVEIDGGRTFAAASVVVARARSYGGSFTCAPLASLDDPTLHVCLFTRPGRAQALRYMAALGMNRLSTLPDYKILVSSSAVITGPPDAPVQADGDIVGTLPARVAVAGRPVSVVVPGPAGENSPPSSRNFADLTG